MTELGHQLDLIEEGKKHLSEKLRLDFEAKGYDLVHSEVLDVRYSKLEKRLAAIAWLAEQRAKKESEQKGCFWIPVLISILALLVSILAIFKST